MRHNINEVSEYPLAGIEERINSMEFSMLDPVVQVYQTGPDSARIVCERDLFVCDIEIKSFENKMTNEISVVLVYKPYVNGVAEEEHRSFYRSTVWDGPDCVDDFMSLKMGVSFLDNQVKRSIAMFAYSYYETYRSKIEAAVKLKRLTEVSTRVRANLSPEAEPVKRREM